MMNFRDPPEGWRIACVMISVMPVTNQKQFAIQDVPIGIQASGNRLESDSMASSKYPPIVTGVLRPSAR